VSIAAILFYPTIYLSAFLLAGAYGYHAPTRSHRVTDTLELSGLLLPW
jgi:hypothetical protein